MDGRSPYRADLIPSGQCVDGEASVVETFTEIDTNNSDMRKLAVATAACKSCIQLEHCKDQVEGLATELWQRGVGMAVIGATEHVSPSLERRDPTADRPAFVFDLATIPEEPSLALAMLRQGSRTNQFDVKGRTPAAIQETAQYYLRHIEATNPTLHAQLESLESDELNKGFKYILTTLFQQKDYAVYSRGSHSGEKAKRRYNIERFSIESDGPLVDLYFRDVLTIRDLGLKQPTTKAMRFEPAFYQDLLETIGERGLRLSRFDEIISGSSKTPMAALEKHSSRKEGFYDHNPELSKSAADRLARSSVEVGSVAPVDELAKTYQYVIPRHIVKTVCETRPTNIHETLRGIEQRIQTARLTYGASHPVVRPVEMAAHALRYKSTNEYMRALRRFYDNMQVLGDRFSEESDITEGDLRDFSELPLEKAVEAAEKFLETLAHLRRATNGTIPDGILHDQARKGVTSAATVQRAYDQKLLSNRMQARARKHHEIKPSPGLVERVTALYAGAERHSVMDSVYDLINREQLVMARADKLAVANVTTTGISKIITPEPHQYLTFRPEFAELGAVDRLVFAHHHNLMPLLYGQTGNPVLLETFALNGARLADYYRDTLEDRITALCQDTLEGAFSLAQLENDVHTFNTILKAATHTPLPDDTERLVIKGVRDAQVVIGAKAFYLHETGYRWDWAQEVPGFTDWLQAKVADSYPPHQQEQALRYAQEACENGVLELLGSSALEYRLVFSKGFYSKSVTELDRASIANAMGIDRLLYGSDLTSSLKHRRGSK